MAATVGTTLATAAMASSGQVSECPSGHTGTHTWTHTGRRMSSRRSSLHPRKFISNLLHLPGIIVTIPRGTTRMCNSAPVAGVRSPQHRPSAAHRNYPRQFGGRSPAITCSSTSFGTPLCIARLTVRLHTALLTHVQYRAGRTARTVPSTDMLAKRYQEAIDLHPVLLREHGFKSRHRALWSGPLHITPAVSDAVHVNVDTNTGLLTPNTQDEVGAFGTNAAERT